MNAEVTEYLLDNPARAATRPVLSVLIPFWRDDPCDLLRALDREAVRLDKSVEVVVLDDGSGDDALAEKVAQAIHGLAMPARFVRLMRNQGRSRGRNRLAAHARGSAYLFLDADMRPDDDRFLTFWADLVAREDPALAFGGFSLKQAPKDGKFAVHRRMAMKAECVPFDQRARRPEKYVYTCNLLVRRDAFYAENFDESFTGWGWEDVEWAARMSRRYTVVHVDNPASHLGLDTVSGLVAKYEQSVGNYARLVQEHRELVSQYPSYKAAQLLRKAPGLRGWRPFLKSLALSPLLPSATRAFSLRLYRAALYADAV
ncbi:MAG: glycosyltransferase family 2 protein [Proteobacteria bacterium]|nr:glycosyltransferase family 2 protein [Pseudomonadota bacterium]